MRTLRMSRERRVTALLALAVVALVPACTSSGPAASSGASPSEIVGDPPVGGPEKLPAAPTSTSTTPAGPAEVEVVLTYGGIQPGTGDVEVGGYAAVVEQDGRCVLTLSRSGHDDVRAEGDALPDVRTTACGLLAVPVTELEAGAWQARLEYSSDRSVGESAPITVEVP